MKMIDPGAGALVRSMASKRAMSFSHLEELCVASVLGGVVRHPAPSMHEEEDRNGDKQRMEFLSIRQFSHDEKSPENIGVLQPHSMRS